MAWTASVLRRESPRPGMIQVVVEYRDGERVLEETYISHGIPEPGWIRDSVTATLKRLNAQDAYEAPPGPVEPLPDPTPDVGLERFLSNLRRLERLWQALVVPGVIPATHARIVQLQNEIRADLPTYVDQL